MRYLTSILPQEDRLDGWRFALKQNAIDLVDVSDDALPKSELVTVRSPHGVHLTRIDGDAQEFRVDYRQAEPGFWLCLLLSGEAICVRSGLRHAAGAVLCGGEKLTLHLRLLGRHRILLVRLPAALLRNRLPAALPEDVTPLAPDSAPVGLLAQLLGSLADTLHFAEPEHLGSVEAVLPEFVLTVVLDRAEARTLGGAIGRRASMLDRVCDAIDRRLGEPDLRLEAIAREFRVSQRYIQKLFESRGESFSHYVRLRRLELCRSDMQDPHQRQRTISDILFTRGFNDSPSFSRAFRATYGITPRDFRRAAAQTDPAH